MMVQILSNARRLSRVLSASISLNPELFHSSSLGKVEDIRTGHILYQWHLYRNSSHRIHHSSANIQLLDCQPLCLRMSRACLTSEANIANEGPSGVVNELYHKMLESVKAETMPPNAWLWSLVENCANRDDIELLFDILKNLRRFRLSNLRIHSNFNFHLCYKIAVACTRAGALDFGKKMLWKHNIYGLTPTIGSANYLLMHAKEHNDAKLLVQIMKLIKSNSLPLQPGTATLVFSICYNLNDWDLISKFSRRFIEAGVKLHSTAFGIWMEFAAKRGDVESIWKIEKMRAKSGKHHTLETGFSCAKAYLLEQNPESAATIIHMLCQSLSDKKKPGVFPELQKLVGQWPSELKQQKKQEIKKLTCSLEGDIQAMVRSLSKMDLDVVLSLEDLIKEPVLS